MMVTCLTLGWQQRACFSCLGYLASSNVLRTGSIAAGHAACGRAALKRDNRMCQHCCSPCYVNLQTAARSFPSVRFCVDTARLHRQQANTHFADNSARHPCLDIIQKPLHNVMASAG